MIWFTYIKNCVSKREYLRNQTINKISPLLSCISARVSGLLIYSNVLISNNQSNIIHRLVRHSRDDLDIKKKTYFLQVSLYLKSIFICVFAGCARPDDSAKRIRESLERLLECIIWVIIMNSFVSFSSRMNEFIILQILLAVYARFTRVLQNLDENLIFKVNKKDIFSTSRSDVSNMFYESQI